MPCDRAWLVTGTFEAFLVLGLFGSVDCWQWEYGCSVCCCAVGKCSGGEVRSAAAAEICSGWNEVEWRWVGDAESGEESGAHEVD